MPDMKQILKKEISESQEWLNFITKENLSTKQQDQFLLYLELLIEWNNKFNITTITDPHLIIADHFQDSLELRHQLTLKDRKGICDIGSGGGFPGIPLSICNPDTPVVLIEINNKKIEFLQAIIDTLELKNVSIYSQNWRMFLKDSSFATTHPLDLFLARASLQPEELIRILRPTSLYKDALLIYWASAHWQPLKQVVPFISKETSYTIGNKTGNKIRQLIFMTKKI